MINSTSKSAPVIEGFEELNFSVNSAFERLLDSCEIAPVGRNHETVVDRSVRCVMQLKHIANVYWDGLNAALQQVKTQLLAPNATVDAELHKVLVYQSGDFFKPHFDSKKRDDHLLTLSVVCASACDGGRVSFDNGYGSDASGSYSDSSDDEEATREAERARKERDEGNPIYEWQGDQAGDWCCWFASQRHSVAPVLSGFRVVATYNVFVNEIANSEITQRFGEAEHSSMEITLGSVAYRRVAEMLALDDLLAFSRTCKSAHNQFGTIEMLCAAFGRSCRPAILTAVPSSSSHFGFLLQHKHSFDGREFVTPCHLRKRDHAFAKGLSLALCAPLVTRPCELVKEVKTDLQSVCYRIAKCVLDFHIFNDDEIFGLAAHFNADIQDSTVAVPEPFRELLECDRISVAEVVRLNLTSTENDSDIEQNFIPFRGVGWMCSMHYLDKYRTYKNSRSSLRQLWGNEAMFSVFWYKETALLIKLRDAENPPFSADLYS